MRDQSRELCRIEFTDLIVRGIERDFADTLREQTDPADYHMKCLDLATRAVRARIWFGEREPSRFQPLPLFYHDEEEKIICGGDFPRHLVLYYSHSLQKLEFNYLKHPLFYDYARGVMAHPDCPSYLQGTTSCWRNFRPSRCSGSTAPSGTRRLPSHWYGPAACRADNAP